MKKREEYLQREREKQRLADMLNAIARLEDDAIVKTAEAIRLKAAEQDQVAFALDAENQGVNGSPSLTELLQALQVEDEDDLAFTFTCSKTGQYISHIDPKQFAMLADVASKDQAVHILQREHVCKIHPAWYYTGRENLQKLFTADPAGYYVYAVSKIFRHYFKVDHGDNEAANWLWHRKLHALWQKARAYTPEVLAELNEMLHRFNAIIDVKHAGSTPIKWSCRDLSEVCPRALLSDLRGNMKRILHREFKKGNLDIMQPYTNFTTLLDKFKGHSQFRHADRGHSALRSNLLTETDVLAMEIAGFMQETIKEKHTIATLQQAISETEAERKRGYIADPGDTVQFIPPAAPATAKPGKKKRKLF